MGEIGQSVPLLCSAARSVASTRGVRRMKATGGVAGAGGWRLDAAYTAPMPEALRSDLARFFAPHNEALYRWTASQGIPWTRWT